MTAQWARRALPFVGSLVILAVLAARVDLGGAVAAVDARSATLLGLALLVYGGVSLVLEGLALARLLPQTRLSLATAMRIKAASYLLAVLHFTLGMGALTLLLRRRAGTDIGRGAGAVLLLAALDLGVLIALCLLCVAWTGTGAAEVRLSVVMGAALAMMVGFVLVRTPRSLGGPLDRMRALPVFEALAATPLPRLVEVAFLRLLFVVTLVGLVNAALRSFGISVPVPDLVVGVTIAALLSVLPIAFGGLGTGQATFLWVFRDYADQETLLACSLLLSIGIIAMRATMGAVFAREYAREARELAAAEALTS